MWDAAPHPVSLLYQRPQGAKQRAAVAVSGEAAERPMEPEAFRAHPCVFAIPIFPGHNWNRRSRRLGQIKGVLPHAGRSREAWKFGGLILIRRTLCSPERHKPPLRVFVENHLGLYGDGLTPRSLHTPRRQEISSSAWLRLGIVLGPGPTHCENLKPCRCHPPSNNTNSAFPMHKSPV